MNYAIVTASTVSNVIVLNNPLSWSIAQNSILVALQPGEQCKIGQQYDEFANPRFFGEPEKTAHTWTAYEFLLRFTESELELVRGRAVSDPICWRFLTLATSAQTINSNDETTIAGMNYLVSISILTAERRDAILAQ
jgi:hypothetical protein